MFPITEMSFSVKTRPGEPEETITLDRNTVADALQYDLPGGNGQLVEVYTSTSPNIPTFCPVDRV